MRKLFILAMSLLLILSITACAGTPPQNTRSVPEQSAQSEAVPTEAVAVYRRITPQEAMDKMTDYVIILDARTLGEFVRGHIPNAVLMSEVELLDKEQIILVYCQSGNRSRTAAQSLVNMGFLNVYDFGGINAWHGEVVIP